MLVQVGKRELILTEPAPGCTAFTTVWRSVLTSHPNKADWTVVVRQLRQIVIRWHVDDRIWRVCWLRLDIVVNELQRSVVRLGVKVWGWRLLGRLWNYSFIFRIEKFA